MKTKDFIRKEWILWVLLIIPFPLIMALWNQFPDQVPIHWNFNGEANSFAPKSWGVFLGPIINIALYLLLLIVPKIDPRRANFEKFGKVYRIIRSFLVVFLFYMIILTHAAAMGYGVDVGIAMMYALLIFFIVIGNYIGNVKPNYFIGIRTPWTLENPEVWRVTHRFASKLWVYTSLPMFIVSFYIPKEIFKQVYIFYFVIVGVVPIVYSYLVYKKLKRNT